MRGEIAEAWLWVTRLFMRRPCERRDP
jgi:hypothetical protein